MNKLKYLAFPVVCFLFYGLFCVLSTAGDAVAAQFKDGTYEGEQSFVTVSVTVTDGRIADIKITHHGGGGPKYAEMVKPLLCQMLEKQSTEVDTVTGATVSSNNLKQAVAAALQKAAAQ